MKKAVIGIVSKHYSSYKNDRTDTYVRDEVKQAIFDNGAVAIAILPPDKDKDIERYRDIILAFLKKTMAY